MPLFHGGGDIVGVGKRQLPARGMTSRSPEEVTDCPEGGQSCQVSSPEVIVYPWCRNELGLREMSG